MRLLRILPLLVLLASVSVAAHPSPSAESSSVAGKPASLVVDFDFVSATTGWIAVDTPAASTLGAACDYDWTRAPITILKTQDGGRTWKAQLHFTGATVANSQLLPEIWMRFFDARLGFVLGPVTRGAAWLYRTGNGGRTWWPLRLPGRPQDYPSVPPSFADPAHGLLLANLGEAMDRSWADVYRTTNGGVNWTKVHHFGTGSAGVSGDLMGIGLGRDGTGWIPAWSNATPGFIYTTRDSGSHWLFQSLAPPPGMQFASGAPSMPVIFGSRYGLLPVPSGESLYLYTHGSDGVTWTTPHRLPIEASGNGAVFWQLATADRWWIGAGRTLERTLNAGRKWSSVALRLPDAYTMQRVGFLGPRLGWGVATSGWTPGYAACASRLFHTTDGGEQWTPVAAQV